MKLLQIGMVVAAVMLSASVAVAQSTTIDGQIQTVVAHCTGAVPDTCGGIVDVFSGVGSSYVTRIVVPAGTPIGYGSRSVSATILEAGDHVRIDYTAAASGNTATKVIIIEKQGASVPGDHPSGF
jgi:hypothetical protein